VSALHRPRALIIADSLALPRPDVSYEHTWPAMLAERLPGIAWINRAQRLSTTERLNDEGNQGADCLEFYLPDIVILQLGICDCAPRVLHRRTAAVVYRLPFALGTRLSAWLERRRGRKTGNCLVPLQRYEANLRAYLARAAAHGARVIAISILPASRSLASRNPRVAGQIAAYNSVLDRLALEYQGFRVLHPFHAVASIDDLFIDGYHLNERGARLIATGIEPLAREAIAPRDAAA
jgi:lysophospholipase L1-like esterase